jgi:hypothetical protein
MPKVIAATQRVVLPCACMSKSLPVWRGRACARTA